MTMTHEAKSVSQLLNTAGIFCNSNVNRTGRDMGQRQRLILSYFRIVVARLYGPGSDPVPILLYC